MVGGPRSTRGTLVHPGAEHMMRLSDLQQKSSGGGPVAAPASRPTSGRNAETPPRNNPNGVSQGADGGVDGGDNKRGRRITKPDISDEPTVVGPVGYHSKVLAEAPLDDEEPAPMTEAPSTRVEPATARKAGAKNT